MGRSVWWQRCDFQHNFQQFLLLNHSRKVGSTHTNGCQHSVSGTTFTLDLQQHCWQKRSPLATGLRYLPQIYGLENMRSSFHNLSMRHLLNLISFGFQVWNEGGYGNVFFLMMLHYCVLPLHRNEKTPSGTHMPCTDTAASSEEQWAQSATLAFGCQLSLLTIFN